MSATLPAKYIGGDLDDDDDLYEDPDDVSDAGALTNADSNPLPTPATASSSAYKRPLTSGIYEHFTYIVDSVTGLKRYNCKHCSTTYAYGSGTTTSRNHLKKKYKIDVSDRNTSKQGVYNQNIATALSRQPALDEDWKNRQIAEHLAQSVDKNTLEYLYICWIITADIPFAQAQNDDFCSLIQYINAPANTQLPRAASTIQLRVLDLFSEGKR